MVVAVIDDGVNESRYSVGHLAYSVEISENLSIRERAGYDRYAESHGLRIVERTKLIDSIHEVYYVNSIKITRSGIQSGGG